MGFKNIKKSFFRAQFENPFLSSNIRKNKNISEIRQNAKRTKVNRKKEARLKLDLKNTNRLYSDDESFFDLKFRNIIKNDELTGNCI